MRWTGPALLAAYAVLALGAADAVLRAAQAEEEGDPQEKFKQVDRDGSGKLEPGELPQVSREDFARADRDHDGGLTLVEAIRWKARQDARTKRGQRDEWRRKFREADKDGDGLVTRGEFPAPEMLFERFDRDGNGQVDWPEALAFGIEEEVAKLFAKHDADLSGTLSADEVPGPEARALLLVADTNGDGQLGGEEALAFLRELTEEGERADGEKEPTAPAMGGTKAKQPAAPKAVDGGVLTLLAGGFEQLDRDRDGGLSRDEFPGSCELLSRMDLDRDGRLTRPELELRQRRARELGARGERLRERARELGVEPALGVVGAEAIGLWTAGRLEELERVMDEIELWLEQQARR